MKRVRLMMAMLSLGLLAGRGGAVLVQISGEGPAQQLHRRVYDPAVAAAGDVIGAIPMVAAANATAAGTTVTQIRGVLNSALNSNANGKLLFGVAANGTLRDGAELTPSGLNLLAGGNLNVPGTTYSGALNVNGWGQFTDGSSYIEMLDGSDAALTVTGGYWAINGWGSDGSQGILGYSDDNAGVYGYGDNAGGEFNGGGTGVIASGGSYGGQFYGSYGLYVSGSAYGIYSAGGTNYFAGRIGVGTSSPGSALSITGSGGFGGGGTNELATFKTSSTGNTAATIAVQADASTFDFGKFASGASPANTGFINQRDNAPIYLYTNNTPRVAISGAGNVGVGTTAPAEKLDVSGNVNIDGDDSTGKGIVMDAANRPLITRKNTTFTSGSYSGAGRWGLLMEPFSAYGSATQGALTVALPQPTAVTWAQSSQFAIRAYNADSSINHSIATFTGDYGVGIGDFDANNYPFYPFAVKRSYGGSLVDLYNSNTTVNSWGIQVRCGLPALSSNTGEEHKFLLMYTNNGGLAAALMAKSGSAGVYYASDERLKTNIVSSGVDEQQILNNINIIDYNMGSGSPTNRITGFSAQNLEAAYPAAVQHFKAKDHGTTATHGLDDMLMVCPTNLLPLLIRNAQHHAARLASVEAEAVELHQAVELQSEALGIDSAAGLQAKSLLRGNAAGVASTSQTVAALLPNFAGTQVLDKMAARAPESLTSDELKGKNVPLKYTGANEAALDPASVPIEVTNYMRLVNEWTHNTDAAWVVANKPLLEDGKLRQRSAAEAATYIAAYQARHKQPEKMSPEEMGISAERLSAWNYQAVYELEAQVQRQQTQIDTLQQQLKAQAQQFDASLKVLQAKMEQIEKH